DSVPDGCDECAGSDDAIDTDMDGVANGCDACPGSNDADDEDGDSVPDGCDQCAGFDDAVDSDGDGVADGCDRCPGSNDGDDADGDSIPDGCDRCVGSDDLADSDGDGVADGCDACPGFHDAVDTDADSIPDGCDQCPGSNDLVDSDGDGVADGCDACPGFPDDADADADDTPDGCDLCPADPARTEPGDCGCGSQEVDSDGDTVFECECVPGDVHRDEAAQGSVDLRDWVLARRVIGLETETLPGAVVGCADAWPATLACASNAGPSSWCSTGDATLDLDDLTTIRRVAADAWRADCTPCETPEPAPAGGVRRAGDVAPVAQAGDGAVNIGDVVALLQVSVGLGDPPSDETLLRGDVSPNERVGDLLVVIGDDRVDISDVVAVLRASVGLDELAWPERRLTVTGLDDRQVAAHQLVVEAWPRWAVVLDALAAHCEGEEGSGMDAVGELLVATCASDPSTHSTAGSLLTIDYRAAEPVDPSSLTVALHLVDSDLGLAVGGVELIPGD
ncbi:MAG: hypothetical protein AAF533_20160, partial [Acidobacteriota bacterium]